MNSSKDKKIQILTMIRNSKSVLFGAFSNTVTKQDKMNEWKAILDMCKALELVKEGKDYSYIRDTFWPNIKKSTLAKVDNAKKTGSGGGKTAILNECDQLVLEILGKESPSVVGLKQIDTMAVGNHLASGSIISDHNTSEDVDDPESTQKEKTCETVPLRPTTRKVKRWITKNSPQFEEHQKEMKLKRRKLELEVEYLELINHKTRIEVLKAETELGLERSKFTSSLKIQYEDD